jgi:tRNA1Val (adenine37-N6)-methyltransferase
MKSGTHFQFKQFSVGHDRSTHKIGTDGVLLGAWVDVKNVRTILDIGTGTGVIALMLAQRTAPDVRIDAVEIEAGDAVQARENVLKSPWPEKIRVIHTAVQSFRAEMKYDLIVSNPPFFINSWKPPHDKRSQARHTQQLPFEDLIKSAGQFLADSGKLAIILPYQEAVHFTELANRSKLFPHRVLEFRSRAHKPIERLLVEFGTQGKQLVKDELVLHGDGDEWSAGYMEMTREFYLKI